MADYPDFEGPKSGQYSIADWAAREGDQKEFLAGAANKARGTTSTTTYLVPAGKSLYITDFGFYIYATNAADSDLPQIGYCWVTDLILPVKLIGGNGGGYVVLVTPFIVTAGVTFTLLVGNQSNHNCDIGATAGGFEI